MDLEGEPFAGVEENENPLTLFEEDADEEFNKEHRDYIKLAKKRNKKLNSLFTTKEIFDRIGYGFAAHQFITILFFLTGASAFFVGIIFAFRNALTNFFSSLLRELSLVRTISKKFISISGIIFGFSFLGMVLGLRVESSVLFAISLIVGSIGVVTYGELYDRLLREGIKHEKRSWFLKRITHYGLIITALCFFISGALMEYVGMNGEPLSILGMTLPVSGYFIAFEFAAIMFILSGFILSKIPTKEIVSRVFDANHFIKTYIHEIRAHLRLFFTNKYVLYLFVGAILVAVIETLGAAYYGYYVFDMFRYQLFGGFMNVALVFGIAIFASFLGPTITKFLRRTTGLAPMFVFGVLLLSLLPLVLVYNANFYAVLVAASMAVIGSSILGVSQSLLARKLLPASERKVFFQSLEMLLIIPFILFVPLGALLAWKAGFEVLFAILALLLVFVVAPLYFMLVAVSKRKRL